MRGKAGRDLQGAEGKGEVIHGTSAAAPWREISAAPAPLSALDQSPEMLQSGFWGFFKKAHGWQPHGFQVDAGGARFTLLVLTRPLLRSLTIAYVPFGPEHDPVENRGEMLCALARALRGFLPGGTLLLRFDLPWLRRGERPAGSSRPRIVKSAHDMQPASTVVVDISPPLDDVLAGMKPKTRYNIRLSAKKGVSVAQGGPADQDAWYELYRETGARDRIAIHSRAYYAGLLEAARGYEGARPDIRLLLARHEGALLAGNIVAFWKDRAAYLYGASSGEKRNLMPTYALQWEAIRMARESGCRSYDLFGVPPRPDPGHPMSGLYQFKTGFSEEIVERWGTWDVPLRSLPYAAYRNAENLRMLYHRSLRKKLRARAQGNDS